MRKLSADYIFTMTGEPIKNGIVTIDQEGTIIDISSDKVDANTEVFEGIICPGFINTHCHLELSHMRGLIQDKTGMSFFIKSILSKRAIASAEQIEIAIAEAEKEMIQNGIVAVGDISNLNKTFAQKQKGNLYYHTFIEIFNSNPAKANELFESGLVLEKEIKNAKQNKSTASIVPHAPYTMSKELLILINEHAAKNKSIVSMHNQESQGEDDLFLTKTGDLYNLFMELGFDLSSFHPTGLNALRSTFPFLTRAEKVLLVHNTFTSFEDIYWAEELLRNMSGGTAKLYWCTCPNANLYIENRLPNYDQFLEMESKVTVGTDSLASNWSLSILDELKTISKHNPTIPIQTLLTWATKNGADFLGIGQLGTIENGKQPGLNLLKNVAHLKISDKTEVIKLI
ncbi:MAG TPA: amidohydrolase family protein [Bacteroidia bacterium]|jgi:cytosine/adenosine deaminase-related metal-dependent hydrolase|nr:amidohydrolase family protein [Bacteroidia bacterium]